MADTPATRTIVTAAYTKWQKRLNQYNENDPGVSKADVDSSYAAMQSAIQEWLKPGPGETPAKVKTMRDTVRKRLWPKFKK